MTHDYVSDMDTMDRVEDLAERSARVQFIECVTLGPVPVIGGMGGKVTGCTFHKRGSKDQFCQLEVRLDVGITVRVPGERMGTLREIDDSEDGGNGGC